MSLVPPVVDDRRFDDLTAEAFERVRRNCPEWTDFNASDPGVTLIELFAWFTELMLYRMNQLPDKLHGELLDLVGIKPEWAKPARTMIEFKPPDQPPELDQLPRVIPRGTPSQPIASGGDRPLRFQTERDLAMVRRPLVAVVRKPSGGEGTDLTKLNEAANRGFDPFGDKGTDDLLLRLKAGSSDEQAGLVFPDVLSLHVTTISRMNRDFSIPKETWRARPQSPPLSWSARMAGGLFEPLEVIEDETSGFSRDGFVRIAGPRHATPILPPDAKAPNYVFELRCRIGAPGYAFGRVPRFLHLAVNAVDAIARVTETEDFVGTSTALQGQVFRLRNRPVEPESIRLMTRVSEQKGPSDLAWTRVDDFADSGRDDRHFVLDAASGEIKFGNDIKGHVPQAGQRIVATSYQAGGGAVGNVKNGVVKFYHLAVKGTNPYSATGGSDAEPAEGLRQRAAARLRSRDRAVTCADFEELALRKGQVARARAIACLHPDFPALKGRIPGAVTVFVMGKPAADGGLPPWATDAEIDRVEKELDTRRMVGSELFVRSALIVPVQVTARVRPVIGQNGEEVQRAIRKALNDYLNSDDRGFGTILHDGDLWSCVSQATIRGTRVVAEIQRITADVGGVRLGATDLLVEPAEMLMQVSKMPAKKSSDALFVQIAEHAALWGRPDHTIDFVGGGL